MKFNRLILSILLCITLLGAGCETFNPFGKSSKSEQKGRVEIAQVETKQEVNTQKKIGEISTLAWGLEYDLKKMTNPPLEVEVALDLNTRILTLSGNPNLEKIKEMRELVDKLTSDLEKERIDGKKKLESKDNEIIAIQNESKSLVESKDAAIKNYMDVAAKTASQADGYKAQIDDLNSWWGLGAVFYGIKRFLVRFAWTLAICSIVFLVLRFAAASNPIAASIFSVFEIGVSWVFRTISTLFPKAAAFAGHTSTVTFNAYKNCILKIVDAVQLVKDRAAAAGKEATLADATDEISKSMDKSEKDLIDSLKTELKWK